MKWKTYVVSPGNSLVRHGGMASSRSIIVALGPMRSAAAATINRHCLTATASAATAASRRCLTTAGEGKVSAMAAAAKAATEGGKKKVAEAASDAGAGAAKVAEAAAAPAKEVVGSASEAGTAFVRGFFGFGKMPAVELASIRSVTGEVEHPPASLPAAASNCQLARS